MDLNVNSVIPYYTENGVWIDPIDTLQTLYDNWYENDFNYEIGDVNQDYMIDILDIVALANGILDGSINGIEYYLADVNGDELLNVLDIIQIVNIILNN